jgi:pyridoxal phosphate enzyme (YggS family)
MSIAAALAAVRAQIDAAARAAGRDPAAVTLVAVSKTHPPAAIREAYAAGQRDFGENYVQELVAKRTALADLRDIRWHFIGHLQSRKARDVADGAVWVHGLDAAETAAKLGARAHAAGTAVPVLLEVNVGGEETKHGVPPAGAEALARTVAATPGLALCGLMAIPPALDAESARPYFRRMRELRDTLSAKLGAPLALSMGMSGDFAAAIAEGADFVRVGTAIFGARAPHQG